ncbi:MAG: nuclear transport factor 2 family protein [Pseudomonadota bacterium]
MNIQHGHNADAYAAVQQAAEHYCRALHERDLDTLKALFHESAHLYTVGADGALIDWPRQHFLDRVSARAPAEAPFDPQTHCTIESVDVAGPEMAQVKLSVAVAPRRYTDYLNFLKIDGAWRVIAKVFRTAEGPPL